MSGAKLLKSCNSPKIKNGSHITIGKEIGKINIYTDHHFNWFQKKMIKWCFGFIVEDYSEVQNETIH